MNRVDLKGNAGRDAEVKTLPSGKTVVNLSVAVVEGKDDQKKTTWINVRVIGWCADVAGRVQKGDIVHLSGKWAQDSWETKEGQKRKAEYVLVGAPGSDFTIGQKFARERPNGDREEAQPVAKSKPTPDELEDSPGDNTPF